MIGWIEMKGELPSWCARAWGGGKDGMVYCGIFQIIDGGTFMLVYQKMLEPKPITERFADFTTAQERAVVVMNDGGIIGRKIMQNAA